MLRKGTLVLLMGCLATFGLLACSDDGGVDPVCNNGVAEGSEQCDLLDLRLMTCADVVPGSTGNLTCADTCTYNTSACLVCGDGARQFGEQCDCGTDPANLPAGCTDVNGGADANCSPTCTLVQVCGDGREDSPEECDCGDDPDALPTGCPDVNGGANANCDTNCETIVECRVTGYWEDCDPLTLNDCCEDDYGVQPVCATLPVEGNPNYCMRECTGTQDCFWSNFCFADAGNICWPEVCGPTGGWPNTDINDYCTVSGGGGQGWCWPIFSRDTTTDTNFGICIEAGTLAHGETCNAVPIDSADRSETVCNLGFCGAASGQPTGTCLQFCDWEAAYAVAFYGAAANTEILPCPTGANCFAESTIDETTGIRSGDLAYCQDTEAVNPDGMTTCSLVTGQLLSNPSETCATAGFTDGRCVMVSFSSGDTTYGTVIGVCIDGPGAVNKAVWDLCDDSATSTDVCPVGSLCTNPDAFDADAGPARCVPQCDTAHPDGIQQHCVDLGAVPTADGTPTCQSFSNLFPPDGPNDTMKTRLGLCGL